MTRLGGIIAHLTNKQAEGIRDIIRGTLDSVDGTPEEIQKEYKFWNDILKELGFEEEEIVP